MSIVLRCVTIEKSMDPKTLVTHAQNEYALRDSGNGEKLERFGAYTLARPDPSALWEKNLPNSEWKKADGYYERKGKSGVWHLESRVPKEWSIQFGGLTMLVRPTSFKHVGLFPEQLLNWQWTAECIKRAERPISVLNLFAYTGGATLSALHAGASVTHIDSSKSANAWAKENIEASSLSDKPVRIITEDVLVFIKREIKRGVRYDGIIMDPPSFGHGPKNELWKIEENFLTLMKLSRELLSPRPLFFLMSGYAAGYSSYAFAHNLSPLTETFGGVVEHGELALEEQNSSRVLPCGIYARTHFS